MVRAVYQSRNTIPIFPLPVNWETTGRVIRLSALPQALPLPSPNPKTGFGEGVPQDGRVFSIYCQMNSCYLIFFLDTHSHLLHQALMITSIHFSPACILLNILSRMKSSKAASEKWGPVSSSSN